jgi:hypothetical protein
MGILGMDPLDELNTLRLQEVRSRIDKGLEEACHGEVADGEAFLQALIGDLDSREASRKAG